jgi:hypothetical protein
MTTINLNTDYLIVGSGAVGMAFADTLLECRLPFRHIAPALCLLWRKFARIK